MNKSKAFVKKMSSVPDSFIDELFEFYQPETLQTDFVLRLDIVAKWLKVQKRRLVETLRYSYKENIDFSVTKIPRTNQQTPHANNNKQYMLTPDCFKRLSMLSRSKNAEMLRTYFIEIESLFLKYKDETMKGMEESIKRLERNQKGKQVPLKQGYIYIIKTPENMYKLGRTKDLAQRLKAYKTGLADDPDVIYLYKTEDLVTVESCVKNMLKKKQYRKYKEVYQADPELIKYFIENCGAMAENGAKLEYKLRGNSKIEGGYYFVITQE